MNDNSTPSERTLRQRLLRVFAYFSQPLFAWIGLAVSVLVGAAMEPAIPALLKPLLDQGFNSTNTIPIWLIPVAVVSLPSWELFDPQSPDYRLAVLPTGIPCFSIEAGLTLAWPRYTGEKGASLGLDRFGSSAPAPVLFDKFGFTVENIARQAVELLRK